MIWADFALQVLASALTILSYWSYGQKSLWGPTWGLLSQIAMFVVIVRSDTFGLLVALTLITFVHIKNLRQWLGERGI
jgi:hypothetical protein